MRAGIIAFFTLIACTTSKWIGVECPLNGSVDSAFEFSFPEFSYESVNLTSGSPVIFLVGIKNTCNEEYLYRSCIWTRSETERLWQFHVDFSIYGQDKFRPSGFCFVSSFTIGSRYIGHPFNLIPTTEQFCRNPGENVDGICIPYILNPDVSRDLTVAQWPAFKGGSHLNWPTVDYIRPMTPAKLVPRCFVYYEDTEKGDQDQRYSAAGDYFISFENSVPPALGRKAGGFILIAVGATLLYFGIRWFGSHNITISLLLCVITADAIAVMLCWIGFGLIDP